LSTVIALASCHDSTIIADRCFYFPIRLAPADTALAVGDTLRMHVTFDTSGGCWSDLPAAPRLWTSSDTTVATIDSATGLLTARAAGHLNAGIAVKGLTTSAPVTVTGP
jgi:uncharacterized protein YjdB